MAETNEETKETKLLNEVSEIIANHKENESKKLECAKNTGNMFNIFDILCIGTREVYICKVLAELLNPNGLHCQGRKYLDLFCKRFLPDNIKLAPDKIISVETEDLTKNLDEIGKNRRRIDIAINEENGHYIPIEVKINAYEQEEQCSDYLKCARKKYEEEKERNKNQDDAFIIYLTKTGEFPLSINEPDKDKVVCISWQDDIMDWISNCIKDTPKGAIPIIDILEQLKETIEMFSNNDTEGIMANIAEYLKTKGEYIESAEEIKESLNKVYKDLWSDFLNKMVEALKEIGINIDTNDKYQFNKVWNLNYIEGDYRIHITASGSDYIRKNGYTFDIVEHNGGEEKSVLDNGKIEGKISDFANEGEPEKIIKEYIDKTKLIFKKNNHKH